jgi:hypothetical protein
MILSKKDGRSEPITLNKITGQSEEGEDIRDNELDLEDYDIEIDTGPSFAVQKEVALEFLQETIGVAPQTFPLIADLWAKNLDVQFMQQISDRFKTLVPPEILAKEEGKPPPPKQPNPQEQMMAQQQQIMQMQMQEQMAEIQNKQQKLALEQEKNELEKAELLLKAQKVQLDSQLDIYNHQANLEKTRLAHGLDKEKAESAFSSDLARILADLHKHANPNKKEENR